MKTLYTACIAFGLTCGCSTDATAPVGALVVTDSKPVAAAPVEAAAATTTSRATAGAIKEADVGRCKPGLQGMTSEGPWIGADKVGWEGTGHEDPEPLRKISNEDMVDLAINGGAKKEDRWHALVSVGRRKAPGAIAAFKAALSPSNAIELREMAMNGMFEHGGDEVRRMLWDILETDGSARLRGKAIWGIVSYSPEDAERAIRLGMDDAEGEVVGMAVLAIWSIYDRPEVALPLLERAAESKDKMSWQEAAHVLSRMPYSDASNILQRMARESTEDQAKQRRFVGAYRDWMRAFPDICN